MAGFNIKYYLQKVKKHPYIYISVTWQSQRVRTPLHLIIEEKSWDSKKQKIKTSAFNSANINGMLNSMTEKLSNFYNERISTNFEPISRQEVTIVIKSIINPPVKPKPKLFLEYFEDFISDSSSGNRLTNDGKPIQISTIKTYKTAFNHLKEFSKQKKFDLTFENIGVEFFSAFVQYCSEKELTNNTTGRL